MRNKIILFFLLLLLVSCSKEQFNPYEGMLKLDSEADLTCTTYNTTEMYVLKVVEVKDKTTVIGSNEVNTNGARYFWTINIGNCNTYFTDSPILEINNFILNNFDVTIVRYNLSMDGLTLGFKGSIVL